jgi:peptidyl-Lys metalloendopeptidase
MYLHGVLILYKGPTTVIDVDNFAVITTITNTGDEPLKLFKDPRTALSPFPVRHSS